MSKPPVSYTTIQKINQDIKTDINDLLAVEEPLEIRLGFGNMSERQQKNISVTMRTPGNDFELALGFLFTEGIINDLTDISQIKYCTELNTLEEKENIVRAELKEHIIIDFSKLERNFYTTSSCGICGKASIEAIKTVCKTTVDSRLLTVDRNVILSLPQKLREKQSVFEHTGGIHASALFDTHGHLIYLREDVGRHNALDKLIGAAIGSGIVPLETHILLLSGRASFELIQKAAMAGIRVVCAIGAPSSLAVEIAKEFNITLLGFLREHSFNIYSNPHRIILDI